MKRPNLLYRLLVLSFTISCFAEGVIVPIYAIFVQKVGGDILDAGFAMGIFLITDGLFTMLIHRFKWNPKQRINLLLGGWIVWVFGIISYLLISNIWMLFLSQILTAIGNAIADPVFDQELADHTDKDMEEYEWGFFEGSKSFIDGAAAIIGAGVAAYFGFRNLIYAMIVTATLSLILIMVYISKLRAGRKVQVNNSY